MRVIDEINKIADTTLRKSESKAKQIANAKRWLSWYEKTGQTDMAKRLRTEINTMEER